MAWAPFTEGSSFIEDVIECLQDIVSREDLQLLVTEDETWEAVLADAELTRDEAGVLREALKGLIFDVGDTDQERQEEGQARETFLTLFPQLKTELMEDVKKLHDLAGQATKMHLNYILTKVLGIPNGTASNLLTLLDLVLASSTARSQPAPSEPADKQRARSSVTELPAMVPVDHSSTLPDQDEARDLMSAIVEKLTKFTESVGRFPPKGFSSTENWNHFLKGIGKNISAIKLASNDLELLNKVKVAIKMENIMVQDGSEVVQSTFGHTAMTISRDTKVFCTATSAVFLGLDLYNLVQNTAHLQEEEKSVLGHALQEQAQELESILEHLNQAYEHLKPDSDK